MFGRFAIGLVVRRAERHVVDAAGARTRRLQMRLDRHVEFGRGAAFAHLENLHGGAAALIVAGRPHAHAVRDDAWRWAPAAARSW